MELLKFMTAFIPNVFLIFSFKHLNSQAAVILAPTGTTHEVCVGKSLEFTCNVTGMILEWSFPRVSETQQTQIFRRAITAEGSAGAQTAQVTDNTTTYTFTRTSAEGSPVSSRLLINAVGNGHNGTEITCSDVSSQPEETTSTTIVIIDSQIQDLSQMRIRADSEFKIDGVKVTLEWLSQENPLYSYYVEIDPQTATYGNSSAIMLMLSYNTPYNISVLAGNLCEDNLTIFNQYFNYSKCDVPSANMISDNTLTILSYTYNESVAVVGSNITFTCIPGMEPKNTTCMENGEWKPHLSCTSKNKQRLTNTLTEVEKIALASMIVFIMVSTVFFTSGFLCRHYYGRIIIHCQKEAETSIAIPPTSEEDLHVRELELKINIAYENVSQA